MHFDLATFIKAVGLFGVWGIIYAESGLLIGFFLPGDSLLFTAGFLASQGIFDIAILTIGCFLAAILGDSTGYAFGQRFGKKLFQREDSLLFHKENLIKAQQFYQKHGRKTIILARFVPVVRTFAPIVAGMGDMEYKTFLTFNIIGAIIWAIGVTVTGYLLGNNIPDIDKYLLPIIFLIIFISIAPSAYHILQDPRHRQELFLLLKNTISRFIPK